jgi:hypothetical protein
LNALQLPFLGHPRTVDLDNLINPSRSGTPLRTWPDRPPIPDQELQVKVPSLLFNLVFASAEAAFSATATGLLQAFLPVVFVSSGRLGSFEYITAPSLDQGRMDDELT